MPAILKCYHALRLALRHRTTFSATSTQRHISRLTLTCWASSIFDVLRSRCNKGLLIGASSTCLDAFKTLDHYLRADYCTCTRSIELLDLSLFRRVVGTGCYPSSCSSCMALLSYSWWTDYIVITVSSFSSGTVILFLQLIQSFGDHFKLAHLSLVKWATFTGQTLSIITTMNLMLL